jgi:hypothetical protein
MTDSTTLTHRLVLKYKRTSHFFVTLETSFILAEQHHPTRGPYVFSMHIMAVGTEHFPLRYRVMVLKHKFTFNVKMACETGRFSIRPDNLALITHSFDVKTSGTVAGLTALCLAGFCILL